MKKITEVIGLKVGLAIFCASMAMSSAALAGEAAKPAGLNADDVKKALGMSIYLQGGYTYNGNASNLSATQADENDLRVFDHKANGFTLDLAQIVFAKDPAAGSAGFKVKLSAGETAKWIHSRGMSGAPLSSPQAGEGTSSIDVTEAYMSFIAPVGKGLRFDLGKMATYMGAEVIEAKDNANYSRSFLFNYAIPFTHTGLKASYQVVDSLNVAGFLVNGWDNSTDNNGALTYGLSLGITPVDAFSAYVNVITGGEQDSGAPTVGSSSGNKRTVVDLIATIKPIKPLAIILNYDDGSEKNVIATGDAKWSGFAGIVKYDISDAYSIAVRGEYFDDKDGYRTGTAQKLTEATLTFEARVAGGLIIRPEYRHDVSDKQVFGMTDGAYTKKFQDTIALGVMYAW